MVDLIFKERDRDRDESKDDDADIQKTYMSKKGDFNLEDEERTHSPLEFLILDEISSVTTSKWPSDQCRSPIFKANSEDYNSDDDHDQYQCIDKYNSMRVGRTRSDISDNLNQKGDTLKSSSQEKSTFNPDFKLSLAYPSPDKYPTPDTLFNTSHIPSFMSAIPPTVMAATGKESPTSVESPQLSVPKELEQFQQYQQQEQRQQFQRHQVQQQEEQFQHQQNQQNRHQEQRQQYRRHEEQYREYTSGKSSRMNSEEDLSALAQDASDRAETPKNQVVEPMSVKKISRTDLKKKLICFNEDELEGGYDTT